VYPWISNMNKLYNALYCRKRRYSQQHMRQNVLIINRCRSLGIFVKKHAATPVSCDIYIDVWNALSSNCSALIYIQKLIWLLWHLLVPLAEYSSGYQMYRIVVTVPKCLKISLFLNLFSDYIKQVLKREWCWDDIHSIPHHLLIRPI
jgi:hypothetical protein